jgi:hypothetical protein
MMHMPFLCNGAPPGQSPIFFNFNFFSIQKPTAMIIMTQFSQVKHFMEIRDRTQILVN